MNPYKYVVIIGVDGAGAFFRNASTPNIDKIFENGAITYNMLSATPTISAQCWGSMLHGVTPKVHGLTNSIVSATPYPVDSKFPSIFRVIRENNSRATLASFSHWEPINTGIVEEGLGVYKVGGLGDAALTDKICEYLAYNTPTMMFVQFDEADAVGHSNGYGTEGQLNKIAEIDEYIGRIYASYEQKGMLDETLFIVTADHGGSGTSHGGLTDAEKYVMFAATGKTVERGGQILDMEIRDTAAIVAYAFGYDLPENWTARVPSGLFTGLTAGERPVYVNTESDRYHESEPTPEKGSNKYVTSFVKDKDLVTYLTFDGDFADACGGTTKKNGNLYFVEGYYGYGVALDDGYVSLKNYAPGKNSFTVSFWMQTDGMDSDPVIFSNKDWNNGKNSGLVLSLRYAKSLRFNMGDGSNRIDADATLPGDYQDGWMHVTVIVDREKGEISICYDFGAMSTTKIPTALLNASLDAYDVLNIGQDGTGNYKVGLPATLDEFMIFDGAFDRGDISALATYYGKTSESSDLRHLPNRDTPVFGDVKDVTNFVRDKDLYAYLTFDGAVSDTTGQVTVREKGAISYEEGVFGQAARFEGGYASIQNYLPGNDSFSISFWIKAAGVKGDPCVLSNKDWKSGKNAGWALSLRDAHDMKFNLGNGSIRVDGEHALPDDYQDGWVFVVLVVDREKNEIRISYDFGEFTVTAIPATLANASADAYTVLNIGQDGTGTYSSTFNGALDELMIFKGALTEDDVKALAQYYSVN